MISLGLVVAGTAKETNAAQTPAIVADHVERLEWESALALREFPLGLLAVGRLLLRHPSFVSDTRLRAESHWGTRLDVELNPLFLRVGGALVWQPLAITKLTLGGKLVAYPGSMGGALFFEGRNADFSDATLRARRRTGDATTNGAQLYATWLLQAKIRKYVVRLNSTYEWQSLGHASDLAAFYDPLLDVLVARRGGHIQIEHDQLLSLRSEQLLAGLRATAIVSTFSGEEDIFFLRAGPLVHWRLRQTSVQGKLGLSLFALMQWHLVHPSRTRELSTAALPTITVGISSSGRLWQRDAR